MKPVPPRAERAEDAETDLNAEDTEVAKVCWAC